METKKQNTPKMDLLEAVEQIVELSKGSHLNKRFYSKADGPLKYLAEKMELTKEQSLLMALFIDNSNNGCISVSDFATHLDCRTTRIIRLLNDIDELERRGLVVSNNTYYGATYQVPWEVIVAFWKDEKYVPKDKSGLNIFELFGELQDIFQKRDDNNISYDLAKQRIQSLFDCNKQLLFVQKVRGCRFSEDDEILLALFSHLFVF